MGWMSSLLRLMGRKRLKSLLDKPRGFSILVHMNDEEVIEIETTEVSFQCPLCKGLLTKAFGNQLYPGDPKYGVTLWCRNRECPSKEVQGWGKNTPAAFHVIEQKFSGRR